MTINNSVMVIGSRDVDREPARALFEQHLTPFLSQGRTWLLGTARGVDHWAIEWLLENNEICWAVVPYTRFKQPQWITLARAGGSHRRVAIAKAQDGQRD